MKKKIGLLVLLIFVAVTLAIGEEHKQYPNDGDNWTSRSFFYSGTPSTSSYKLDWKAFYGKMDRYAKNIKYNCIYITVIPDDDDEATLLFATSIMGTSFGYSNGFGQNVIMTFSSDANLMGSLLGLVSMQYSSYADALNAFKFYVEEM